MQGEVVTSSSDKKRVWLLTENTGKLREARSILKGYNIAVSHIPRRKVEIQGQDLREIALFAARAAAEGFDRPVIIEDSGLFITELNGFPGPYSSYVHRTLGTDGILRLVEEARSRKAYFQSSIAACLRGMCKTFSARVYGVISPMKAGKHGFGFDPIFALRMGSQTFGQMSPSEKNRHSHRALAFRKFAKWFRLQ